MQRLCEVHTLVTLAKWMDVVFDSVLPCAITCLRVYFLIERKCWEKCHCLPALFNDFFLGSCHRVRTRYGERRTFDKEYSDAPLVLRISVKAFASCEELKHLLLLLGCQKKTQKGILAPSTFKDCWLLQRRFFQYSSTKKTLFFKTTWARKVHLKVKMNYILKKET